MLKLGLWTNRNLKVIRRHISQANLFPNQCYKKQCFSSISITLCKKFTNDLKYEQLSYKLMSTDSQKDQKKNVSLMNFDPIIRPQIFLTIKNWVLIKMILQPYLDNEFSVMEFVRGAKQAIVMVSNFLANGNFEELSGLVDDNAIPEIKRNHSLLNIKERQDISINLSDILFTFPYQVGLIFDDQTQKRFCEITVVYHVLKGFDQLKNSDEILETAKEKVTICNYRFIREYTKGVQSNWIINRLGHFRLIHLEN